LVHVLLIEDDMEAATLLVRGLRESGYTVEHAADGRAGLLNARLSRGNRGTVDVVRAFRGPYGK
jgi:two-component system OmpR family response regulator